MREILSNLQPKQREDFIQCSRALFPLYPFVLGIRFHVFNVSFVFPMFFTISLCFIFVPLFPVSLMVSSIPPLSPAPSRLVPSFTRPPHDSPRPHDPAFARNSNLTLSQGRLGCRISGDEDLRHAETSYM